MAISGLTDPSITVAHIRELATATGHDRQNANVLRGARELNLRFACTPAPCQLCWLRHKHQPDRFPRPTGGARFVINSSVTVPDGYGGETPYRLLVCTDHAALRLARAGARRAIEQRKIEGRS